VLGAEFAGTVAAASQGSPYKPGDRVFGVAQGAYGERVVAKLDRVLPLPDTLSFDQGAGTWQSRPWFPTDAQLRTRYLFYTGLSITYPTSYEALVGRAKLQAGAHTKLVIDGDPQIFLTCR
jgi:hypothetical protein